MTVAQLYLVSYPRSDAKPLSGSITSIKITPKNEHWSLLVLVLLLVFRVSSIVEGRGINRTKPDSWLVESRATGVCNILAYCIYSINRHGIYYIFRDSSTTFIRGRRLFKIHSWIFSNNKLMVNTGFKAGGSLYSKFSFKENWRDTRY